MKKTLSLLLALVMVIGLFPGFADEKATLTAEEAGAVLQGYGAIKGGSDGNLMIDKELKRQDAVVILTRLMGKDKEVEAMPKETKSSFEDITIDYYQPFLAFAEANKWVEGKAEKKFGFNDVVTVKEFTAMLLRALGHDTMGDNYAKVMDLAKEQGLFQGVMAEEAAPVIRGVAFIMMNNTLETAPKGEKQALVYKLGYKEMPKPENLVVTEVMSSGLKTIDIKFSKAVDETSLQKVVVKEGTKKITVSEQKVLEDGMVGRLVLQTIAKQDAKYTVITENVKSQDLKETVEKNEATIYMTDNVRPEVQSVEVVNPKTLLVKVSEPLNTEKLTNFKTLNEFKIEGKALAGRVQNANKNEIVVELGKALKAGDHKLEVSGLRDYANFIAKTMEFDITVVEDKDAPMVVEAKMVTINKIKVMFNEPVSFKGMFKVDGNQVPTGNVEIDAKDKRIVNLTGLNLNTGAIVEVAVQYKGQKDIMANQVKDWMKFTFKVNDDTQLPEVKSIEVDGTDIKVMFNKSMLENEGKYTIKKGTKVVVKTVKVKDAVAAKTAEWDEYSTELTIKGSFLSSTDPAEYTIIFEDFKDGTVRKNELPKYEGTFSSQDVKNPTVKGKYAFITTKDKVVQATLFFSEAMDETTVLDAKNFHLMGYKVKGKAAEAVRADKADVTIYTTNNGKNVVIEATDEKVEAFGDIKHFGLKDLVGNQCTVEAVITENKAKNFINSAELVRDENGDFQVKVKFVQGIENIPFDVYALKTETDGKDLGLIPVGSGDNNAVHYFKIDQENINSDATHGTTYKKLEFYLKGNANEAASIYGDPAPAFPAKYLTDAVMPSILKDKNTGLDLVKVTDDFTAITVAFDEILDDTASAQKARLFLDGKEVAVTVTVENDAATRKTVLQLKKTDAVVPELEAGEYTVKFEAIKDKAGNVVKDLADRKVDVAESAATFTGVAKKPEVTATTATIFLKLSQEVKLGGTAHNDLPKTFKEASAKSVFINNYAASNAPADSAEIDLDITSAAIEADNKTVKLVVAPHSEQLQPGDVIIIRYTPLGTDKLVNNVGTEYVVPDYEFTYTVPE